MQKVSIARLLSIALTAALFSGAGTPAAHAAEPEFAIRNAMRPGATAPHCPARGETPDGCTFHTLQDGANRARLPLTGGASWTAHASDPALVTIRHGGEEAGADGVRYQLFDIAPTRPEDADITVTFDKLTAAPAKVVERRRVTVMKHSHASWHEH